MTPTEIEAGDERRVLVLALARELFETEERCDPGTHSVGWAELDDFSKGVYEECVWRLLDREEQIQRFFALSKCAAIARAGGE